MAAKFGEERVVSALKSLSADSLSLPEGDRKNIEALIEEYFDDSGDDTGSKDEEVKSLFLNHNAQLAAFMIMQSTWESHGEYKGYEDSYEDNEGAHTIKMNKMKLYAMSIDTTLVGSLFEEVDSLVEQLPDNYSTDIDDQPVPLVSDIHTSCACIPNGDQQSSSATTMPSSARANDVGAITVTQPAVKTDHDICMEFYEHTCGCQKADGKPCSSLFPLEHFVEMRSQASLMTRQELDLVIMGSLLTTIHDHESTVGRGRHKPSKRSKITSHFMHNGFHVCIHTFAFLFGIGANHRIKAIKKHYLENGMEPRVHKNAKRLPPKTTSYEDIMALVKFLQNYAETNAILLPGRIPGYKRDDIKLLPSSTTKKVHFLYTRNAQYVIPKHV